MLPVSPAVVGLSSGPIVTRYRADDCILYALGVGARPDAEYDFLYEGALPFRVLPTFSVVASLRAMSAVLREIEIDYTKLLHGEHAVQLHGALPSEAELFTTARVTGCYDKGKAALLVIESSTVDANGVERFTTYDALFIRGAGGFGGPRSTEPEEPAPDLSRAPDVEARYETRPEQALLYRLSGDKNPIHADPTVAGAGGFRGPILHGLCTYGHMGRAVLHAAAGGDPARISSLRARFSGIVYPGDTITVQGWKIDNQRYALSAYTDDPARPVLTRGVATVRP